MKRETSIESYHKIKDKIGHKQSLVLNVLRNRALSNRQIASKLRMPINQITPRTNELVRLGLVYSVGKMYDKETDRTVYVWSAI